MNRYLRFALTGAGFLLVCAGVTAAYWWLYKLAPLRHLADPKWRQQHSETARWTAEQQMYKRLGVSPDLCFRADKIGYYGGKEWCLWLLERTRHPEKFRVCGCTEYVLSLMSNRHGSSWKKWAKANRERSQEEWIKDGFSEYSVDVHLPPQSDDTLPLLRLLGRKSWNFFQELQPKDKEAVPNYVQYNAFRWLRDSGFDPYGFAHSNQALLAESQITVGLLKFCRWKVAYPGGDGLGVLAFGRKPQTIEPCPPLVVSPWFEAGVFAFIAASLVSGLILLFRFTRSRNKCQVS